jgi:predicted RNA-binding protein with PIN domain
MFLVDGYNAIRRIPALFNAEKGAGLAGGRRALLATLVASGILRSSRVMVVFDAREEATGIPEPSPHRMLSVRYSTPPLDADATILSLLESAKRASGTGGVTVVTVVTADGELSFAARLLGARVVSPEAWEPLQMRSGKRARRSRTRSAGERTESDKPRSSSADVGYWLTVFGDGEDDGEE